MIILEATQISGLAQPTYNSGGANKKYVDDKSFNSTLYMTSANALSIFADSSETQLKLNTKLVGSTVSSNFFKITSGNTLWSWYNNSSNKLSVHENDTTFHLTTTEKTNLTGWYTNSSSKLSALSGSLSNRINTKIAGTTVSSNFFTSISGNKLWTASGNLNTKINGRLLGTTASSNFFTSLSGTKLWTASGNLNTKINSRLLGTTASSNFFTSLSGTKLWTASSNLNTKILGRLLGTTASSNFFTITSGNKLWTASSNLNTKILQRPLGTTISGNFFTLTSGNKLWSASSNLNTKISQRPLGTTVSSNFFKALSGNRLNTWMVNSGSKYSLSGALAHNRVTLAGTPDYLTIADQVITRGVLDLGDDVNFTAGLGITRATNTVSVTDYIASASVLQYYPRSATVLAKYMQSTSALSKFTNSTSALSKYANSTNVNARFVKSGGLLAKISSQIYYNPPMLFNVPNIQISANQNINVARFKCPTGKSAYLWQASACGSGGYAVSGMFIQMLSNSALPLTAAHSKYKTSSQIVKIGNPLANSAAADFVEIRFMYSGNGTGIQGTGYKFGTGFMNVSIY